MGFALANLIAGMCQTLLSLHHFWRVQPTPIASAFLPFRESSRDGVYNILWAVVFGFATLNILSLAARRFEPNRRGLSYGEMLAVLVVLLSIFLLGWELLSVFRIFPIKIRH
jgi:hypothetical protein